MVDELARMRGTELAQRTYPRGQMERACRPEQAFSACWRAVALPLRRPRKPANSRTGRGKSHTARQPQKLRYGSWTRSEGRRPPHEGFREPPPAPEAGRTCPSAL